MKKTWWAPLRSGLILDPKHREKIGQAVWLLTYFFMYTDRKTGKLNRKIGTIAKELEATEKNIQRWMRKLEKHNYIKARRLWQGYHIEITKWRPLDGQKLSDNNVQPLGKELSDNPISVTGHKVDGDRTISYQSDKNVQSLSREKEKVNFGSPDNIVRNKKSINRDLSNKKGMIDSFLDSESEKKWNAVLKSLCQKMLPENFDTWFASTVGLVVRRDRVLIGVPNRFYGRCLEENYKPQIREALLETAGFDSPPVPEFQVMSE